MQILKQTKQVVAEDGILIEYDHYTSGNSRLVVIAHGFSNNKQSVLLRDLAQSLIDEYDAVILDFRGHGKSKGLFCWASKEPMDLEAVIRDVKNSYSKVYAIGFSYGAAISLNVAVKTGLIDNLIYVSGPSEYKKIDFHWWALDFENDILFNFTKGKGKGVRPGPFWLPKEQPINILKKLRTPIFYIHGSRDWIIKPWHSEKLYQETTGKKCLLIIKNGPHAEYLMREPFKKEFVPAARSWFEDEDI